MNKDVQKQRKCDMVSVESERKKARGESSSLNKSYHMKKITSFIGGV